MTNILVVEDDPTLESKSYLEEEDYVVELAENVETARCPAESAWSCSNYGSMTRRSNPYAIIDRPVERSD